MNRQTASTQAWRTYVRPFSAGLAWVFCRRTVGTLVHVRTYVRTGSVGHCTARDSYRHIHEKESTPCCAHTHARLNFGLQSPHTHVCLVSGLARHGTQHSDGRHFPTASPEPNPHPCTHSHSSTSEHNPPSPPGNSILSLGLPPHHTTTPPNMITPQSSHVPFQRALLPTCPRRRQGVRRLRCAQCRRWEAGQGTGRVGVGGWRRSQLWRRQRTGGR
mmetsp:Transcript_3719/g.9281  ORF Transcript_3719/g.9281 Transcript_3719/m.9281 type:complete len:217 (+) Transcript_3719:335-985(+)